LADITVGAVCVALKAVLFLTRGGKDSDRKKLRALVGAKALENLEAVDLRELEIEEHELGKRVLLLTEEVIERLGAVAGDDDVVLDVALLERADGESLVVGVV